MFARLFKKIKENRGLQLILFAVIIIVYIFVADARRYNTMLQDPLTQSVANKEPGEPELYVDLLEVSPNGVVNSLSGFDLITFEFSHQIDPTSVVVVTRPHIETQFFVSDEDNDKHLVKVMPYTEPWLQNTEYTIDIIKLKSVEGYSLRQRARTKYKNIPPDTSKMIFPF